MTPRERVIKALSHSRPDRIPRYEIFLPGYMDNWHRVKGIKKSDNYYDFYNHYPKVDIGAILATQKGPFIRQMSTQPIDNANYLERDSWGRLNRHSNDGVFFEVVETVIKNKDVLNKMEFEDPNLPERYQSLAECEKSLHNRFAPVAGVMGLFMASYYLRGELEFLMDMAEDEDFCRALAEKVAGFLTVVGGNALRYTNTWDTAIWVYDELGNNKSSVMSPDMFEKIFLPSYKRMISSWKSQGAKNIILHCDGDCLPLLDLLLEAGFTGLQGVNPTAGMTVPAVKKKYGNRLSIIGGMCNIQVLAKGTHQDIERNVASIMEVAQDGGVIIGTHSIDLDIPVESYDYYYSLLEKYDQNWN